MSFDFKLRRALAGLSYKENIWAPVWMAPLEPRLHTELFCSEASAEELYDEAISIWNNCASPDPADRLMEFFTLLYLQDDILMKTDRASMMSSLETRAVYLDNDLVEFCRRLPRSFKYRNRCRKYLLRKAVKDLLPSSIIERKKKGFGIPLTKWLRAISIEPALPSTLRLSHARVRDAWMAHRMGDADERLFLWSCLCLQHVLASGPQVGAQIYCSPAH